MATTAVDAVFLDTNVLVYSSIAVSPLHAAAWAKMRALVAAGHSFWLSRQILREYLATMSRPGTVTPSIPMAALLAGVQTYQSQFQIAEDSASVMANLHTLLAAIPCAGKQVHDANIVATMLAYGIPKLLTHNTADFNRFAAYIQVMPLV